MIKNSIEERIQFYDNEIEKLEKLDRLSMFDQITLETALNRKYFWEEVLDNGIK